MDDARIAPTRHRLSVDAYYRSVEAGAFAETDKIELLDGDLIDMAPIGQEHEGITDALTAAFFRAFAGRVIVRVQSSIRLDPWSAPEPDIVVLRARDDYYRTGDRAGPGDVLLLVEVADSSLRSDREVKLPLYARAGIVEVWIVDVQGRVMDVHRGPSGDRYATVTTHRAGETVALVAAPEIVVPLDSSFL